jgi:hypothetical protein
MNSPGYGRVPLGKRDLLAATCQGTTPDTTGLSGGGSRFSLHLTGALTAFFSTFRSDGNAVAAEWGKEGFLGRRL